MACASSVDVSDGAARDARVDSGTVASGCLLPNGGRCAAGAVCPAGDGCNTCSCASGGAPACTRLACVLDASVPDATAGPDVVATDAPASSDAGRACGERTCGPSQLCVRPCCSSMGCNPQPPFCFDIPSECGANPQCACFPAVCRGAGGGCGGLINGDVQCVCF